MSHNVVDEGALDLASVLKAGDRIVMGQACGEPGVLADALLDQAEAIGGLSAFIATSFSGRFQPERLKGLSLSSMGAIGSLRTVATAHRLSIIPCHVSQVGPMIEQEIIGCDVVFIQVSQADENGNHSLGLISDHVRAAVDKARVVVAEINDRVPFTFGESLSSDRVHLAVRTSREPVQLPAGRISSTDEAIARHAAAYVHDGSVLQVGIGGVPEAILRLLTDRRDLGVHSGMVGDGLVDLIEAGVVTNARKAIDPGVSVTGALIGTRRLYDFARRNPALRMAATAYTHDAVTLAQLDRLVTVNSAIEVDLTGQVNAEQSGSAYLGGTGGQVDFVRAGARSPGGHSIIALPATAKVGSVSRIVVGLDGPVTTARSDVDVIVTEFGAAELKGQSLAERARRLVRIAHPDFREALERAAHDIDKRGY